MFDHTDNVVDGDLGKTLSGLAEVIHSRWTFSPEESYSAQLLTSREEECLGALMQETESLSAACKDGEHDNVRFGLAGVMYHLLVVAERYGVTLEELAGELDARSK